MRAILFATLMLPLLGRGVYAQSAEDKAGAEQLFAEARRLLQAGQIAEACPKLEASLHLEAAPGTELNLADCYEKLGRYASAWGTFRQAADDFRRANNPEGEHAARDRAAAVEAKLSRLTLQPATEAIPGLVVTRNGVIVGPSLLGVPVPVDAGSHRLLCSAPGRKSWTQDVTITVGNATVVPLPNLVPDSSAVPSAKGDREVQITIEQPHEGYEIQLATTGRVLRCDGLVTRDRPCHLAAPAGPAVLSVRGTTSLSEDFVVKTKPILVSVDKTSRHLLYGGLIAGGVGVIALGAGLYACSQRNDRDVQDGTPTGITCVAGSTFGGVAVVAGSALVIWDMLAEHHAITLHGDDDDAEDVASRARGLPRHRVYTMPTTGGAMLGLTGTF